MRKLLLVEDNQDFGSIMCQYLALHNFEVEWKENGAAALEVLEEDKYDLCILDVMMPHMDGFELAERIIDQAPEVPFLFLTARKMKEDKLKGLQLGAEDYVIKPFEAEELVLRIQNILKRRKPVLLPSPDEGTAQIGAFEFDLRRCTLKFEAQEIQLTEKEAALLQYLNNNRNTLLKRDDILVAAWGNSDFFSGRSMDVFISRLRKHLKADSRVQIKTVRGIGLEFIVES